MPFLAGCLRSPRGGSRRCGAVRSLRKKRADCPAACPNDARAPVPPPLTSARTIDHYTPQSLTRPPDCTGRGPGADQTYHTHTYTKHTHIQPSTTSTYYAPDLPRWRLRRPIRARAAEPRDDLVLLLRTKPLTHYRRSRAPYTHTHSPCACVSPRTWPTPRPLPTHVATHTQPLPIC